MDKRDKSTPIEQDDVLIGKIKLLAGKTETDPNPEELESLKKLIKKNVPWRLRGYFMAYLLREITKSNKNDKAPRQRSPKSRNTKAKKPFAESTVAPKATKNETKEVKKPKVQKPLPEGAKTLYLNVGKMKKLYTKELSLLLQDKLSITRDDIYSIRVHDKYSFITMDVKNCEKAIELLDGTDIKGRTASITYSKKK
ncbi:MAG: DbpA RNA binding domain-containing protein [Sphaerochaetaceae bacterium]|nr:DbpA RNA binding domain-containing protein [Sphaerochaetaceae bacterium]MDC7238650.1 DbpA RNA binding domain-containing protein [Sphaerochaetaceae bacterium]MDC7243459.1 DbpA RNA binding domain-containing protein [Sphaerochaetaceae bacterium]MDC7250528.1 DbpA RNA binding domain-containing protein [Sphaerochaetaceae bacterium]